MNILKSIQTYRLIIIFLLGFFVVGNSLAVEAYRYIQIINNSSQDNLSVNLTYFWGGCGVFPVDLEPKRSPPIYKEGSCINYEITVHIYQFKKGINTLACPKKKVEKEQSAQITINDDGSNIRCDPKIINIPWSPPD